MVVKKESYQNTSVLK